ncbi:MAG: S1/P1 nuclease [Burkholderiales bacterium]
MFGRGLILIAGLCACGPAWGWGQEGHSIVAEIAQRRLSPAAEEVEQLLGRGHSLASEASWADDIRDARPETYNWHFVDIPLEATRYDPRRDCRNDAQRGDCVVAELERLRSALRCAPTEALKREALRFAVHFVGDVHQPLHTVLEERGGNDIRVVVRIHELKCAPGCRTTRFRTNFHALWDQTLIAATTWSWGAYVRRLESGWLKSPEAQGAAAGGSPSQWAAQTHAAARTMWHMLAADRVVDDAYYAKALPVVDRQLGLAGLRLARFLNEAYASTTCPRS